jgi:hypothetical protein
MKKILTFLFALVILTSISQTSTFQIKDLNNGLAIVNDGQVFLHSTTGGGTDYSHNFEIKNVSANTHTFAMRKFEDLIHTVGGSDKAYAYFCFDAACFIPATMSASIQLLAGQSFTFYAKLDEASTAGESHIRFRFSNSSDPSDASTMTFKYNSPVSIRENSSLFSAVSALYPNPASSKFYLDVTSTQDLQGSSLKIYNSLGSVVATKMVLLSKGKNTLMIDAENLEAGVYFVNLSNGASKSIRKIIVNK